MRVRLTGQATDDIRKVGNYYDEVAPEVADRFLDAVDDVIERLRMFPDGAPPVEGFDGLRRARMRQFPYGVFYQRSGDAELHVIRVLHNARDYSQGFGGDPNTYEEM